VTFSDIFKSSFLENVTSVSILDMVIALALAFGIGVFIFFIYKKTFQGVMYSPSFGVTLIALTMITTLVILAVTSNVVLSLGMVGALSIVRFRTAIKDPLDIAFLFWSIAVGIILAAGMIPLAVFGSIMVGLILVVFVNRKSYVKPYIIVVSLDDASAEKGVMEFIQSNTEKLILKGKTARKGSIELTYEVRLNSSDAEFVTTLSNKEHVESAVLVSYNGEYQ